MSLFPSTDLLRQYASATSRALRWFCNSDTAHDVRPLPENMSSSGVVIKFSFVFAFVALLITDREIKRALR